jgi:hypothetical protein
MNPNPETQPDLAVAISQPSLDQLFRTAIETKGGVEVLERLMVIRRELRQESAREAFNRSMAEFQRECPTIAKDKAVANKGGHGVRYRYAPLEHIVAQTKDMISRHGFSYTIKPKAAPGIVTAVCEVTHSLGHTEASEFSVPVDKDAYMNEQQKVGSALTFAKRYAFCAAFGIMTGDEDDDSNSASTNEPRQQSSQRDPAPVAQAAPAPSKADPKRIEALLEESKAKLLRTIQGVPQMQLWVEALRAGWLMQNEQLKAVSAHLLFPTAAKLTHYETAAKGIKGDYDKLMDSIKKVAPTAEEEAMFAAAYGPKGASTEQPERPPTANDDDIDSPNAPWRSFPVPFGQSSGTPLGKLDKKKLFGFFANFEVEETYEGKPRPKDRIERDRQFRAALDSAGAHYAFTLPEDRCGDEPEHPARGEPLPPFDENGNPI